MKSTTTTVTIAAPERYAYLDLTEDLQRAIKDAGVTEGAAIVFFACSARASLQHRESFQGALLLFGDEDAELLTLLESPGADGFHVASAVDPTVTPERLAGFQRRYEEKHKQRPTPAAVLTYDAIIVWAEAAHRADELEAAAEVQEKRLEGAGVAITYLIGRVRGLTDWVRSAGLEPPTAPPIPERAREFIHHDV